MRAVSRGSLDSRGSSLTVAKDQKKSTTYEAFLSVLDQIVLNYQDYYSVRSGWGRAKSARLDLIEHNSLENNQSRLKSPVTTSSSDPYAIIKPTKLAVAQHYFMKPLMPTFQRVWMRTWSEIKILQNNFVNMATPRRFCKYYNL